MNDERAALSAKRLNEVFGGLRAEYFRDEIFELFAQPGYWPELLTRRPCLLVGGRGTGKTTALRGLSYEGLSHFNPDMESWNHLGLYWRIDTNTVRAFKGGALSDDEWGRLFAHYINIVLVQLTVDFLIWVRASGRQAVELNEADLNRCCRALLLPEVGGDIDALAESLEDALVDFEASINNIGGSEMPDVSVLGRPVTYLTRAMARDARFTEKRVFFLVDEYENFENYQQRVFNTLVKHAGDELFSFKIGMKATGHREKSTLNPDELLVEPADYALIDIADRLKAEDFAEFAKDVCLGRLSRVSNDLGAPPSLEALLPSLSEEAEAQLLGVTDRNAALRERLADSGATPDELGGFDQLAGLSAYLIEFWSRSQTTTELEVLRTALLAPRQWETRVNNYKHAALYTIRRGRRGISKYYAGWGTFVLLANGNIRYLLQLINEALQDHLTDRRSLEEPVNFAVQTLATQAVGRRLVEQLQGLSAQGADLTKLVLGLGRVFQVMAADPEGHTPEVSQFRVTEVHKGTVDRFADDVLTAAVMHQAVRRFAGDKMASASGETKEYNYQLHPMFAPFFVFSYRSKRRMDLSADDVYGLVKQPRKAIREVLERSSRTVPEELPEQMTLFQEYFG